MKFSPRKDDIFLNIITPCARPKNLEIIEKSINIPKGNFRWIVVFDSNTIPNFYIPSIAEAYCYKQKKSKFGNAQRNFALDLIEKGHVYFNDDDTIIHPELWQNIKNKNEYDFISFTQAAKNKKIRLIGNKIAVGSIDSHNFIVNHKICKDIRFEITNYCADGVFASHCYKKSNNILFMNKVLSIYNFLR